MTKTLGMIIGRFQHLHIGHVEMIQKGLSACDKILLLVGSSQESGTLRNPFTHTLRQDIIHSVFHSEIKEGRLYVAHIPDLTNENDHSLEWGDYVLNEIDRWREYLKIKEPLRYMVYGNDEERNSWYRSNDIQGVSQLVLDRGVIPISATEMRGFLLNGKREKWLSYMPLDRLDKKEALKLYEQLKVELLQIPEYASMTQ